MSLSTEQMVLVEQRLNNEKKSIGMVYLLWLFLGGLGIHRFYLGKTRSAVGMLVLTILGGFTLMVSIGAFLLIGLGIWLLVDAFLIPDMIKADSQAKRAMIANEVNIMANSKFT